MNLAGLSAQVKSRLLWAFVVIVALARFIHLDADPKIEHWVGYITDEGRWIETARNLVLFGDPGLYPLSKTHLALSPGFQAVNFLVFKFAGVAFWSARFFSAASGAAILIFSFLFLRRRASGLSLYLGVAILAFEPLTLSLSRAALPEVPALLFTLLAFSAICTWQRRVLGATFGGLFLALAISMKGTTVLLAPGFLVMVALSGSAEPVRRRMLRCSVFLAAVLLPAVIGLVMVLAAKIFDVDALLNLSAGFRRFLELGSPYTIAFRFFETVPIDNVYMLLLGAWVCSWILLFREEYRGTPLGEIYLSSGIWSAAWLIVWSLLEYSPARYFVQVFLPLTIHLVAGLNLWRSVGPARVLARMDELRSRSGPAFMVWLVLPAAIILLPLVIALAGMLGLSNDRLLHKLLAFGAIVGVLAILARATRPSMSAATGFIVFPVAAALPGMTADAVAAIMLSRPAEEQLLPIVHLVMLGVAAWYCWARSPAIADLRERLAATTIACGLALAGLLCQSAPILLQPTFSIRDASRDLARRFPVAGMLWSVTAGSLFLETRIPYRDMTPQDYAVDGMLIFVRAVKPGPEFVLETAYRLAVHPRYQYRNEIGNLHLEPGAVLVDVYRSALAQRRPAATELSAR